MIKINLAAALILSGVPFAAISGLEITLLMPDCRAI